MGLGKSVERERTGGVDDLVRHHWRMPAGLQGEPQFDQDAFKAIIRTMKTHATTEFLRLRTGETSEDHGDGEHLFLKEHHAPGSLQYGLE